MNEPKREREKELKIEINVQSQPGSQLLCEAYEIFDLLKNTIDKITTAQ